MEEENKILGYKYPNWLVPVLAILVIFQAVVLATQKPVSSTKTNPYIPVPEKEVVKQAQVSLSFVPSGASVQKGQNATVDLVLTPKKLVRLDGADIVLEFDPQVLQITQINTPKLFSIVSQKRENETNGKIYITFLEEGAGGVAIDKEVKLMTLTVKGKKAGEGKIAIITADKGPSTVLTENATSKKMLFDKGSLKVVVY